MSKKGTPKNTSPARKRDDIIQLLTGLLIIVLLNYVVSFAFQRIDLTADKRYSLTPASVNKLNELEDIITVKVYLDGDLPANFKRLRDATKELLDELRAYGGENIQYEFIDPSAKEDDKKQREFYQELTDRGLKYTNIRTREADRQSEQIIFPGAIINYRDKELPLQLMQSNFDAPAEVMVNNSIQQLEYGIMSTIKKLTQYAKKRVGIVQGNGEAKELQLADISKSLNDFYIVEPVEIDGRLDALKLYNALIIAGPDSAYSEKDKYMIDQFIMRGGKVMWFVEPVQVEMDSIRKNGLAMALPKDVNLADQLFKYGARINTDLVMDLQAMEIPVVTGMVGNRPRQELFPWPYFPRISPTSTHPIVNNLDAVKLEFASSIEFVGSEKDSITKTPLLTTSKYTKVVNAPHRVALNILRNPPDERQYNKPNQNVAVLLEGKFESLYKNRIARAIQENPEFKFREKSTNTSMIVASDATLIQNEIDPQKEIYYDLGYDRYSKRVYGNKQFVLNGMSYLLDNDGLINARAKTFKLRLLDKQKIKADKRNIQIINTAVPVLLILIFGIVRHFVRKKLYT